MIKLSWLIVADDNEEEDERISDWTYSYSVADKIVFFFIFLFAF